ncbi:hypothetical protein NPIL_261691 [Nephila pilipes]|uniref:Uncharacterized protein n=1 Tax=Nephila pilipes TaxID=299642 RepID=A0A8X6I7J7_NEPPI|nr:hypothetical protein NPIL_261691 [Nephila pilipes]
MQACHKSSCGKVHGCIHDSSRLIAYFNSDRLNGRNRYTGYFKYLHIQKSAGVKSGDPGGHGNLRRLSMILSSPNVCIKNSLTGLAVMLRVVDSGKPKDLPATHALLAPAADSEANVSISAATRAERVCLRLGFQELTRSSSDPVF